MNTIQTKSFHRIYNEKKPLHLLDVREEDEYKQGHIKGATLFPMSEFATLLPKLDPNTHYYLICRSGRRSADLGKYLAAKGYNVTNIEGGMLDWEGEQVIGIHETDD